jgi:hydroxymethylglutaryl-CoA lyase
VHGTSRETALRNLEPLARLAAERGLRLRGHLRAAVVCPLEGVLKASVAAGMCDELRNLGCFEISLGECTGEADPDRLRATWDACAGRCGPDRLAVRLSAGRHALPGLQALLERGLQTVDTALGSLDRAPSGTVATEDVVDLLEGLDIATWIDPEQLTEAAWWYGGQLGRAPASLRARRRTRRTTPTS